MPKISIWQLTAANFAYRLNVARKPPANSADRAHPGSHVTGNYKHSDRQKQTNKIAPLMIDRAQGNVSGKVPEGLCDALDFGWAGS